MWITTKHRNTKTVKNKEYIKILWLLRELCKKSKSLVSKFCSCKSGIPTIYTHLTSKVTNQIDLM